MGFKTAVQDKVLLLASQTFNQNFQLQVGSVSQQVVVNDCATTAGNLDRFGWYRDRPAHVAECSTERRDGL